MAIPEIATSEFNHLADLLLNLGVLHIEGLDLEHKIEGTISERAE